MCLRGDAAHMLLIKMRMCEKTVFLSAPERKFGEKRVIRFLYLQMLSFPDEKSGAYQHS